MKTNSTNRFANRHVVLSLLAAGVAWLAWPMVAKAEDTITVSNPSFETPGSINGYWAYIGTFWSVGAVNQYSQNKDDNITAADGSWSVYLPNIGSITQDLATAVSAGDVLSVSFSGGRAVAGGTGGGGVFNATFLVGSTAYTASFDTTTHSANTWRNFTLTKAISNSGNLRLVFSTVSGNPWLDNVGNVRRIPVGSIPAGSVPVSNSSFETPGDDRYGWSTVSGSIPWAVADPRFPGLPYSRYYPQADGSQLTHPADGAAGNFCVLLSNVGVGGPLSQDLLATVQAGDILSVTFYGGRGKAGSSTAAGGTFNAAFKVGDTTYTSDSPIDTAAQDPDSWQQYTLTKTIANSGYLSLVFSYVSGNPWLDKVGTSVTVITPRPTPTLSGLTASPTITYGTAAVTLSGIVSAAGPVYPADGETVNVTINSVTRPAPVSGGAGGFSVSFPTATIPYSASPYTITYAYPGNGTTLDAAANDTTTSLTVNQAPLTITANDDSKAYGQTRTYGSGSTAFTPGAGQLKNGNAVSTVTITDTDSGGLATAALGSSYRLTPSLAVFGSGSAANYTITYATGTLTVGLPLRLVAEASVQVDTRGPIGTAQTATPVTYPTVTYGITSGYLNGDLFEIGAGGALTFKAGNPAPDNNVGDVYYVEVTATDSATPTPNADQMLVKVTVVNNVVASGTIFSLR